MSEENFAEKMKAAKAAKEAKKLVAEQAKDLNEQIQEGVVEETAAEELKIDPSKAPEPAPKELSENIRDEVIKTLEITSTEIEIISSEFHNFGHALFEKNKPTFLTEKVLKELEKLPNFQALVGSGVIKIGL